MAIPEVYLADDPAAVARWSASLLLADCTAVLTDTPQVTVALAGGTTPRGMYQNLVANAPPTFPWHRLSFWFGDERVVALESPDSNAHQAMTELLVPLGIAAHQIHPLVTDPSRPEHDARRYEALLRQQFPTPDAGFDLMLLGLGADGHTASLFPGQPLPTDSTSPWVVPVQAPASYPVRSRLTLTPAIINRSDRVLMVATGAGKQAAVARVLAGDPLLPSTHFALAPASQFGLLIDREAAGTATASHPNVTVLP